VRRVGILGANGQVARNTTRVFLRDTDAKLTLYLRRASRLKNGDSTRVTIVDGDVLDAIATTRPHDHRTQRTPSALVTSNSYVSPLVKAMSQALPG
jgi:NAD(P)H-binding